MVRRALLVLWLVVDGILALAAFGNHRLVTRLSSFATVALVANVILAELHLEAILSSDERTAEVVSRRWG
jgi:hypothetical protein